MKQLELKHLAPYLPYGLNCIFTWDNHLPNPKERKDIMLPNDLVGKLDFKPIFHPLADLTKEIEVDGEKLEPLEWFNTNMKINRGWWNWDAVLKDKEKLLRLDYRIVQKMFEWHFDVFALIDAGLAIDINTLGKHPVN